MRIGIVNQFAPPDEAPTAVLAGELAEHLRAQGHEVELIACKSGYRKRGGVRGSRLLHELGAHLTLFWKCLRLRKPDVLLALSTPAILPATVDLAARLKRCRFAHWAMDVYPDVAVALGELKARGVVHRVSARLMRRAYRRAAPLVSLTEDMKQVIGQGGEICPPWPPTTLDWPDTAAPPPGPFTWLYSGNLGRAHLYRPMLLAQKKLEERGLPVKLIFQGRGHLIPEAKALAGELGLAGCEFRDYVPREELLTSLFDANVLVATQNPQTAGMLWPSKLAVMDHVPRPVLWIGDDQPIARATRFSPGDVEGISDWLEQQLTNPTPPSYSPPPSLPETPFEHWENWIRQE